MSIFDSVALAWKNIISSKSRTLLTMLGIIIGVAAVIVIIGLGNGLELYVTESFSSLGTNTLNVTVMSRGSTRTLSADDFYDIVEENDAYLERCSPTVSMRGIVKIGNETADSTSCTGVSEEYLALKDYAIARGRDLQYSDILRRSKVCVIGAYLDQTYFGGDAVGQTLRIGGDNYEIVGVMAQEAEELDEGSTDDCVFIPYSVASRLSGGVSSYVVTIRDEDLVSQSKKALDSSLFEFFGSDGYYMIISMSEILDVMTSMIDIMVGVLAGIAAISLLVGGIGIMNIMLVSVTERTREIGIRKSLGAKERYIMQQFVIEAASTSALGGIIGIGMGYVFSAVATKVIAAVLGEPLTVVPTPEAIAVSFGISVGIGILFGYLPAKKAAQLNPIDALRYD